VRGQGGRNDVSTIPRTNPMSSSSERSHRSRLKALLGIPLLIAALAGPAAAEKAGHLPSRGGSEPAHATVAGSPLTILAGADHSFQILNDQVPGTGQLYPSQGTGLADMGWIVRAGGVLYGPDFQNHEAGTATGGLGTVTPYGAGSVSAVSGSGSEADPYVVVVAAPLAGSGLQSRQEVRYVNGRNYFSKRFTLTNAGAEPQSVSIYLGGDIYLAASDSGIPYLEPASQSPGGRDCGGPRGNNDGYYILYIPQTPADRYTGTGYSSVWSQIGSGDLDGVLAPPDCIDNGAALQWNRTLAAGSSVTILATTSFGEIPSIAQFDITSVTPAAGAQGAIVPVTIRGIGFANGMTVSFGNGIAVDALTVVDAGTATATLTIAADAPTGFRDVVGIAAGGNLTATLAQGFQVTGAGEPDPFTLTRIVPASGVVGTTLQATLQGTGFQPGMTVTLGAGVTVSNLVVTGPTTATLTLAIAATAVPGPRDVVASLGGKVSAALPAGFLVIAGSTGEPPVAQAVPALSPAGLLLLMLGVFGAAWAIGRR
jgi:hypothetical protein